jgi:hypothetical protein
MNNNMTNMTSIVENVPEGDKQILKSVAPLVIVLVLFIITGKFAITQITNVRNQISLAKKSQSVLSEKLKTLRSSAQISADGSGVALIALPKSNPSLQVISQLKMLASSNLALIEGLRSNVTESSTDEILHVTTSFSLVGPKDAIIAFVKGVDTIAPITFVEKMELVEDAGLSSATITTRTYFASLPKTIPTVTQPITDLTLSEKDLLTQLSKLSQSAIDTPAPSSGSGTNANPFGL